MPSLIVFNCGLFMRALKQRCVCRQQDVGITVLAEDSVERGGREGKKVWSGRGVQEDGEESAPLSGCQIPAGMLACQLSRLRRPAEMIMGLCGLAILPLTDYCNAIIGVQMGPCLSAQQPREHQSLQVIYSHRRLLPSHDGTERLQHGYRLPIQS